MRDLALLAFIAWGISKALSRPHVGIYLWTWISLMNPHRLVWGFASQLPWAQIIVAVTAIGMLTGKQQRLRFWSREVTVLLLLVAWICFTALFAVNPEGAVMELEIVIKIQVFIFLTMWLISDKQKLDGLIWVMVLSLGYYGVKGGIWTVLTGGHARVLGPAGSFIAENNGLALALLMTVPLMRYLSLQATNVWVKRGLSWAMIFTAVSILGSQSRGAFLGIMAIGMFFWWKSPKKLGAAVLVAAIAGVALFLMPDAWWDRMNTIGTYEQDDSAMSRINTWTVAWGIATHRITGGGLHAYTPEMYRLYAPNPDKVFDWHSIYFEMLAEQGFIGLGLFLLLFVLTWRTCGRMARICKNDPDRKWAVDLAPMIQVSLIGYATAGAFLGRAYFDYAYDLVAVAVIASKLALTEVERVGTAGPVRIPRAIRRS
jgi:probable O-glycosylation ligase (exosortase A-associated)